MFLLLPRQRGHGARGAAAPPPPPHSAGQVEPVLWIEGFHYSKDLSSLDSVNLFVVTCSCLPFSWPGNRFVQGLSKVRVQLVT